MNSKGNAPTQRRSWTTSFIAVFLATVLLCMFGCSGQSNASQSTSSAKASASSASSQGKNSASSTSASTDSGPSSLQSSEPSDAKKTATSAEAASASSSGSASAEPATSTAIDLSNPDDYRTINLFLSNFSEASISMGGSWKGGTRFETDNADVERIASFVCIHTARNNPDLVESSSDRYGYYDSEMHGNYRYNMRITEARADELCLRYFGRTYDFTQLDSMDDPYYYRDGYIHWMTTNGAGVPEGITLATSVTDLDDGTIRVDFEVYGRYAHYDVQDESLYSCTPEELMERMEVDGPLRTGTAIVRFGEYNEYTSGLHLVSWETSETQQVPTS